MNIRFYNARILSADNKAVIEGELWVEGNKISYIGGFNQKEQDKVSWDRQIDVLGNLLLPGFKNAHTHSAMTFLRSYADDMPLFEWLTKQVFPKEAKLKEEDVYILSKLAIMEYLSSGITANFDMYYFPKAIADASIDTGFRTALVSPINDYASNIESLEEEYIKYNSYHELISYHLGFHAEYTTSEPLLKKISNLANKYKAPVFTHNSETKREVEECIERHGATPTEYLASLGLFEYGGGGYHCIYVDDNDLEIMKEKDISVVTNPASNLKLASGIAPIKKMTDRGIRVAIGTDGPASNNCLDMFREMFLVSGLSKMSTSDAAATRGEEVLNMAVSNGAIAMGYKDADCLDKGKLADIIMIDLRQPNMQPLNSILNNIVYSGSKSNIKMTMVNGRILYEDGKYYINSDIDNIYERANKIIESMK